MDVDSMLAGDNPLSGILGAALGESAAATAARVDEAKKNATDLSGLVRRKPGNKESEDNQAEKQSEAPAEPVEASTNGKRKAEEPAADEEDAKKTKIEDQDAGPGETAA